MRICKVFLAALFIAMPASAANDSPVGVWKTVDDVSHKPRGFIRLYEEHGEIFGRIESSLDPKEAAEVCAKCDGERKNKPVVGMIVLRHMKKRGAEYSGGDILDPDSGWVYRCRMWLEQGGKVLVVRGFLGLSLVGRSQMWYRADE